MQTVQEKIIERKFGEIFLLQLFSKIIFLGILSALVRFFLEKIYEDIGSIQQNVW